MGKSSSFDCHMYGTFGVGHIASSYPLDTYIVVDVYSLEVIFCTRHKVCQLRVDCPTILAGL